jgi:hemerythrin-like metal-binding protein
MPEKFVWSLQYSVHSEEIDEQHRRYFEIINSLYDLAEHQKEFSRDALLIVLTHLGDYAFYHFATEEGYFKIFNYKDAVAHTRLHDGFRNSIVGMLERVKDPRQNLLLLAVECADFAKEWLAQHILTEDKKYMPLFSTQGVR